MALEKELALAIDFKKAPKELQDAATAAYEAQKKVAKLRANLTETNLQLEVLEAEQEKAEKALRVALKAWTPEV